jgi:hypothetical protein
LAAESPFRHEQRFSLKAAAAHLQQSKPDVAAAIKARAVRMGEIHLEIKREAEEESSAIPGIQKQENTSVNAAAASLAPTSAPTAAPALVQPPHPPPARLRFPSLRLDPALSLSATALRFFAGVSSPHDVRCLVTDASLFVARHVRAYHKVWAPWEWQRLAEHELMQQLQQSVPLLPHAGVAAAAAAAAAVATWPWYVSCLTPFHHCAEIALPGMTPVLMSLQVDAAAAGCERFCGASGAWRHSCGGRTGRRRARAVPTQEEEIAQKGRIKISLADDGGGGSEGCDGAEFGGGGRRAS